VQNNETKSYEHIAHILLAIAVTAVIGFGLGCYAGSNMEQKHEQSFYNLYVKPMADSDHELIQNIGNNLKRCQDNLTEYRRVTMGSFADFEAQREELAKMKEALDEANAKLKESLNEAKKNAKK
jgi:hypothetical protein